MGAATLEYRGILTEVPEVASPRFREPVESTTGRYESAIGSAFAEYFAKLGELIKNRSLWPQGGDAPSEFAVAWARSILEQLEQSDFVPSSLVASAEGGVAICFVSGEKYSDIECLNSGDILGVTSNRKDRPTAWEIEPSPRGITSAAARIRAFLNS